MRRTDNEEFVSPDSVRLICDKQASKSKIDALVADRLGSGFDFVISDMMTGGLESRVSSHVSARGRNDLQDKNISTILRFLSQEEYCKLNIIGQFFGIDEVYQVHYRDLLNQAVGRNRGLRRNPTTPRDHEIIVSPTLFRCLGKTDFFASGRYPAYLTP